MGFIGMQLLIGAVAAVGAKTGPDDITHVGTSVYVAYQNAAGSKGGPSATGETSRGGL